MSGLHCFHSKHDQIFSASWAVDQSALDHTEFDRPMFREKSSLLEVNPIRSRGV